MKFSELRNWTDCHDWKDFKVKNFADYDFSKKPCNYFTWGKQIPSTLSLTVLVMIEMFNALNATSDEGSLFQVGLFANPMLLLAMATSFLLHCGILYIPVFEKVFNTVPLDWNDWKLVLMFSLPVFVIEEILKFISRSKTAADLQRRRQ